MNQIYLDPADVVAQLTPRPNRQTTKLLLIFLVIFLVLVAIAYLTRKSNLRPMQRDAAIKPILKESNITGRNPQNLVVTADTDTAKLNASRTKHERLQAFQS